MVENGCSMNYCVKAGDMAVQEITGIQRPPFMDFPNNFFQIVDSNFEFDDEGTLRTNEDYAVNVVAEHLEENGVQNPSITETYNLTPMIFTDSGVQTVNHLSYIGLVLALTLCLID